MPKFYCSVCNLSVGTNSICCDICLCWVHFRCSKLSKLEFVNIHNHTWYCPTCACSILPFSNVDNLEINHLFTADSCSNTSILGSPESSNLHHNLLNQQKLILNSDDTDPDFNNYSCFVNSKYYDENDVNDLYKKSNSENNLHNKPLSVININCRSLKKNFDNIVMYLNTFAFSFDILLFCETWLRDSECSLFSIPGYTGHFVCRQDRIGGGVAIYTKSNFKIKLLPDLSNSTGLYNNASVSVESLFIEVLDVCNCSFIVWLCL